MPFSIGIPYRSLDGDVVGRLAEDSIEYSDQQLYSFLFRCHPPGLQTPDQDDVPDSRAASDRPLSWPTKAMI